jgi:hypothetical protein
MVFIGNLDWTRKTVDIYGQQTIWLKTLYGVVGAAPGGVRAAGPQLTTVPRFSGSGE